MKKNQFAPLTASQVKTIEELTKQGIEQREIRRITGSGRNTIRKYKKLYYERLIKKAIDNYQSNVQVYRINYFAFVLFMLAIVGLSGIGLYFIINL